jgi:hypothetical protein
MKAQTKKTKGELPQAPVGASLTAEAARLTGALGFPVSTKMVRWWKRKEYPLGDLNALRGCLLTQERLPDNCDPRRLQRDMASPTPEHAFGRRLREVIEGMPCAVIGQIRAEPDKAMHTLVAWVMTTIPDLVNHPGCPDGLPLTEEEQAATAAYLRGE